MKKLIPLLLLSLPVSAFTATSPAAAEDAQMENVWNWCSPCDAPESVVYDQARKQLFVSNVGGEGDVKDGNGWISRISLSGKTIKGKWLEGLNAPKGMRIHENTLWVSDIDEVMAIDIPSATIIRKVPVQGAEFLNDVAVDSKGNVFVSDTPGSTIYKISAGSSVSTFDSGAHLDSPNGLLIDGGILWVASWGLTGDDWSTKAPGGIYSLDLKTREQVWIKKEIGHLDGLERLGNDVVFSDWMSGSIVQMTPDKNAKATEILKLKQGAADIAIIDDKTLVVPQMQENNVSAFSIETIQASATTPAAASPSVLTVYRSPGCGCCGNWIPVRRVFPHSQRYSTERV